MIHAGTFRVLADLRASFFASIEPLAPAGLRSARGGDLLARITADVGTLEEAFAGVAVPPIAAAGAVAFGCVLLGWIDPIAGWILLAFAVAAGLVLPGLVRVASREPARERIARARADHSPRARRRPWGRRPRRAGSRPGAPIAAARRGGGDGRRDGKAHVRPRGRDRRVVAVDRAVRGRRAVGGDRRGPRRVGPGRPARHAAPGGDRDVRGDRSAGRRGPAARRDRGRWRAAVRGHRRATRGPGPARARVTARGRSDSRSTASGSGTRAGRATSSTACRYRSRRAGGSRSSDPAGPASQPWSSCSSASTTTRPARSGSAAASCAGWRRTRSGRRSPSSPSGSTCSTRRSATTSHWRTPT